MNTEKPNVCCISTPSVAFGTNTRVGEKTENVAWGTKLAEKDAERR